MKLDEAKALYKWYYQPGEKLRSIGFYMNPYRQFGNAKFDHIFALDGPGNLYIGQYSSYQRHLDDMFDLAKDKQEFGKIIKQERPFVILESIESKNIILINRRIKKIAQRMYDYGLPLNTIIRCTHFDLCDPTLFNILKGKATERPDKAQLEKLLRKKSKSM